MTHGSRNRPHVDAGAMELAAGLSHADLDTLRRLHDAGIIKLDALHVAADPRLVEWTYEDLRRHLIVHQRLQSATGGRRYSTVEYTLQYLRFLEGDGRVPVEVPVQLRPPSESSWLAHVEHRLTMEEGNPGRLNDYRKALQRLLKFLGLPVWPCLGEPYESTTQPWTLPSDDIVPRFWHDRLHDDPAVNRCLQYIMHWGYHSGVRPPSELVSMQLSDVDLDAGSVVVREWKKQRQRLLRGVEDFVLKGQNSKSLANYVHHVRPETDSEALWIDPRTGRRWEVSRLQQDLSAAGKRVWPRFSPYTMRHWCATQRLIASDFDVYYVARWLGDTVSTVEAHYIDHARAMEARGRVALRRFSQT